ncbi:tRNA pseudouridine(55) synthase TruB [Thermosipho atlanticus]|uniref:tRNA pseudouridine synthase B n=1 Tax=Thermosipho atlanticus DSM 15807 TaxID=1123380 RepID=A0A1M5T4H2_9BACT|nr:tRNA pseudouridine(55) synthase TruB [Thermosipho atlanticus]SHH45273.1 tRNA pseudouridine synthase B [Thermosipho atlanticus DSM 15807]
MNGILNIFKPKGMTSHDVIDELRRKLNIRKVGHAGTLDPFAEGVLIVGVGPSTRLLEYFKNLKKRYFVKAILGVITETYDITGEVQEERECRKNEKEIESVINSFKGKYLQVPPAYSAKKYKGKKLYELARKGKIISLPPKEVEIFEIKNITIEKPYFSFEVEVSPGTYIRSLCMDIGYKLSCGATTVELIRTRVGDFRVEDSLNPFENSGGKIKEQIIPVEQVLKLPKVNIYKDYVEKIFNGIQPTLEFIKEIKDDFKKNDDVMIMCDNKLIAIARAERNSSFFETLITKNRLKERVFTLKKVFKGAEF